MPRSQLSPFSRRRAAHLRLGQKGEHIACRLLKNLGLTIITRNYRDRQGEIDIVARDGTILCFVEVKTRRRSQYSSPAEAVTAKKQESIIRTAQRYIHQLGNPHLLYRFDIIELVFSGRCISSARYWPNAYKEKHPAL